MTASLHRATGETRPDGSFAASQLQRKLSASLESDHKRAVPTVKRLKSQPEIFLKFRLPALKDVRLRAQTPHFTTQMQILTESYQTTIG